MKNFLTLSVFALTFWGVLTQGWALMSGLFFPLEVVVIFGLAVACLVGAVMVRS